MPVKDSHAREMLIIVAASLPGGEDRKAGPRVLQHYFIFTIKF